MPILVRFGVCGAVASVETIRVDLMQTASFCLLILPKLRDAVQYACGVQVEPLKSLFQAEGVGTELVFVNSYSPEMCGNAFVEAGVPHVVAVRREIVTGELMLLAVLLMRVCLLVVGGIER